MSPASPSSRHRPETGKRPSEITLNRTNTTLLVLNEDVCRKRTFIKISVSQMHISKMSTLYLSNNLHYGVSSLAGERVRLGNERKQRTLPVSQRSSVIRCWNLRKHYDWYCRINVRNSILRSNWGAPFRAPSHLQVKEISSFWKYYLIVTMSRLRGLSPRVHS